ncbi:MAG: peptide deformylase [Treponema sp.]|jgi:peptide deformylase|nr:peptide deformylase [Treponema sp.]
MHILTLGDERLRQKAAPVREIGPAYQQTAEAMFACLHSGKGVGLAGPQVGIMERIFVVHIDGDAPRVFINPSILETSAELGVCEEGCLSIPGQYAEVTRPQAVKVQAWNERGKPFTLKAAGTLARVIQHEYDHLEGVLFIDKLPEKQRGKLTAKFARSLAGRRAARARAAASEGGQ